MSVYILSIIFSITFIAVVLELVRRQKLREQYSILWLIVGVIFIIFSLNVWLMEYLAKLLGIIYAPAMLLFFGLIFCLALILHLTIVVSKMNDRIVRLSQEVAILKTLKEVTKE